MPKISINNNNMDQIENILSDQINQINKLVLSGGGYKGCIYVGMWKYLEENGINKQIKTMAGTSIGALICTLISIGYSYTELEEAMIQFDYKKYQHIDLDCLFEKFGIDSFQGIEKLIELLFLKKEIPPNITLDCLYEKTKIHLIITAVCLNTQQTVFFDYHRTPEMQLMIALKASMALPYLFASVNHKKLTYIDGGVLDNFPIDFFTDDHSSIFGIDLHTPPNSSVKEILTIDQYSLQLMSCVYNAYTTVSHLNQTDDAHIITISIPKFKTFDFNLLDEDKKYLYEVGYEKTKTYFETNLPQKIQLKLQNKLKTQDDELNFLYHIRKLIHSNQIIKAKSVIDQKITDRKQIIEKNEIEEINIKSISTQEIQLDTNSENMLKTNPENILSLDSENILKSDLEPIK